ncbi:MAG TPA: carboxypeptidase-like regulatory domain-containing protein, partial [Candidatus Eisenbacteria bacterium]|nr:carboxypeptidase-like regulatory domain-containing protein [Candidatus Eisenbacteria bacterium]
MQRATLASRRTLVGAALALAFAWLPRFAAAQEPPPQAIVHGTVVDATSGQPVAQARVTLHPDPPHETLTDKDGEFRFPPVAPGPYEIEIRRLGYAIARIAVNAHSDSTAGITVKLDPRALPSPEIEVTTARAAERETPVAFTELDRKEIRDKYWAQDVPMLLAETPGT